MKTRCTDPACPIADIENHAHLTAKESDELANQVVQAIIHDLPESIADASFDLPDAESMSAALRRAEQERDELAAKLARILSAPRVRPVTVAVGMQIDGALGHDINAMRDAYLAAEAELASARQELDAVRTARDNLDRQLAEARATIRALTRTGGTT